MNNMLFDHFPAAIMPWPEGVPRTRIRVVGFENGTVVLWDAGGSDGPERVDIPSTDFQVSRGDGCACGSRRLRSMKVTGVILPEPESEPEAEAVAEV
jgi:hypothetical protein